MQTSAIRTTTVITFRPCCRVEVERLGGCRGADKRSNAVEADTHADARADLAEVRESRIFGNLPNPKKEAIKLPRPRERD
jgi:hypothetical protein